MLLSMAPSVVAVDPFDLESSTENHRVYLYDSFAEGLGLSAAAFERIEEFLLRCRDVVAGCPCAEGCPGCVHLPRRPEGNDEVDKAGALAILEAVVGSRR